MGMGGVEGELRSAEWRRASGEVAAGGRRGRAARRFGDGREAARAWLLRTILQGGRGKVASRVLAPGTLRHNAAPTRRGLRCVGW